MTDETDTPEIGETGRRTFLQKTALGVGGIGLGALGATRFEDSVRATLAGGYRRTSSPSKLKITDMRVAVLDGVPFTSPIVKIYTNQDITGLGDMRDGSDKRWALMLKSILLDKNPLNVERLYRAIRRYGGHARHGGGVSAVEMALMDIAGKYYGVPVHQLIGGQYRNRVRLYTDTTESEDPQTYGKRLKRKVEEGGYTFLKMDLGINLVKDIPGTLVGADIWENEEGDLSQYGYGHNETTGPTYGSAEHPFTRIQLTEKGVDEMAKYVEAARNAVGPEIPLGIDHFGHLGVNELIQLAKRFEEYDLAFMENVVAWFYTDQLKEFTKSIPIPSMVGEDIFGLDPTLHGSGSPSIGFKALIDQNAVDLVHPDITTAGGVQETKKIGDYAQQNGVAMFLHYAGSPIGAMASAHVAAACPNFVALENHSAEIEFWEDLVTGIDKPIVDNGFYNVPESPGLGVELNDKVAKKHLANGEKYFAPTEEWNDVKTRPPWE